MCAIFGILGTYNSLQAKRALATMTHRGPDFCGIVEEARLFFAHHRLSIVDTRAKAHQPLRHQQVLISFNGEIYNYKALKEQLHYRFTTHSDAEVVLAAYLQYGVDFVHYLRGMFAIAIVDGDRLYLFRDRFGKKPLYYHHRDNTLVFASEIKAITPFLKRIRMNHDALLSYLSYLAPTPPHTFYEGIHKLEAGCYLLYEHGTIHTHSYYDLTAQNLSAGHQSTEALLRESIALRLQADVPVAGLLSGGIDSAMIAAIAREQIRDFSTFTLGYRDYGAYDERANAAETARYLGVNNCSVEMNQADFMEVLPKVLETLDEPLNDPAAVPLFWLFQEIQRQGYKVVLSGEGSDEIFLGYRHYREYAEIESLAGLHNKNWIRKYFRSNFSMNREWEWYKRIFCEQLLFRTSGERFSDLQQNMLLRRNVKDNHSYDYLQPFRERFLASQYADDATFWYSYIDLKLFQAEHFLMKLDKVSMAHSIEARTPFLDHHLVEKVLAYDASERLRYPEMKRLLKELARGYLHNTTIARKKKGFSNPYMEYLTASGGINLITEVNQQSGLFRDDVLQTYLQKARKGRFKHHVWGLYVLSYWMKRHLL
ncbi:MAG: asparagine synthase (glutamine-hydrolyzing) [Sulfurimonas sp.]|nr:MAG: asparagine synthase (glutamine-hydrolyzing) [Sulfurimonas sp.]